MSDIINTYEAWVEELCTINCIDWDHDDPHATLCNLINIETTIALDPAVSLQARLLIEKHGGTYKAADAAGDRQ